MEMTNPVSQASGANDDLNKPMNFSIGAGAAVMSDSLRKSSLTERLQK